MLTLSFVEANSSEDTDSNHRYLYIGSKYLWFITTLLHVQHEVHYGYVYEGRKSQGYLEDQKGRASVPGI